MKKVLLWSVTVLLACSNHAFSAQKPIKSAIAGEFDSYVFSLSWQPTFCETKPDKKECKSQTPERFDAKNLVLHGLWPNKNNDPKHTYGYCGVKPAVKKLDKASTWCKMPALDLSDETKADLTKYMPGYASCLQNHEWYKHGTCSGMDPNEYFITASKLVAESDATSFNKLLAANIGKFVKADDLLDAFEQDFGSGSRKSVGLYCQNVNGSSMLSEVQMYLSNPLSKEGLKESLIQPQTTSQGNCPDQIYIDPVAKGDSQNNLVPADINTIIKPIKSSSLSPLVAKGQPADWWFVFKLNAGVFPGCAGDAKRSCIFGGNVQTDDKYSQQYVYASSKNPTLQEGSVCVGDTLNDPVGSTFDAIYNGSLNYIVWNDQFYNDPNAQGCGQSCSSPWGHSKGAIAWNGDGEGLLMQVTTPSWPASGSSKLPRNDGNTLGCVSNDNNIIFSQHFFSLRLTKDDLTKVLQALQNSSVVTDSSYKQIVSNGGPSDVQALVSQLGKKSSGTTMTNVKLSTGVKLISKPSALHVPPWQMVSATLNGTPLRAATWWANPQIDTTTKAGKPDCWSDSLGTPGPVQIASTGQWNGKVFNLTGGSQANHNHAKIGVSTDPSKPYTIFGDLNQQGALSGNCGSSQNGRGGMFFVLDDKGLFDSVTDLIKGGIAFKKQ